MQEIKGVNTWLTFTVSNSEDSKFPCCRRESSSANCEYGGYSYLNYWKCYSPFQHANVLVRDETFNAPYFASPPITGSLAVKNEKLSHLEGQLCWRSRYIVKHSDCFHLCTHMQTQHALQSTQKLLSLLSKIHMLYLLL